MSKKPDATKSVKKQLVEGQLESMQEIKGLFVGGLKEKSVHVGTQVKNLREDMSLSQGEVAADTGLSQSYISRIEKGEAMPSRDVLDRISKPLNTSLATLVDGTSSESVLEEPTFTQSHAYCPNVDCPGTVYRSRMFPAMSVAELKDDYYFDPHGDNPFSRPESLLIERKRMGHDITLKEILLEWRNMSCLGEPCEIEYRWVPTDENTVFCQDCGTKLRNTCRFCETLLRVPNQKFCHKCGKELNKPPEQEKGGKKK